MAFLAGQQLLEQEQEAVAKAAAKKAKKLRQKAKKQSPQQLQPSAVQQGKTHVLMAPPNKALIAVIRVLIKICQKQSIQWLPVLSVNTAWTPAEACAVCLCFSYILSACTVLSG